MTHAYHEGLEGFVEGAAFQDGCEECEHRAANFQISHMDPQTWVHVRTRALELQKNGLMNASQCEIPVLRIIAAVISKDMELIAGLLLHDSGVQ